MEYHCVSIEIFLKITQKLLRQINLIYSNACVQIECFSFILCLPRAFIPFIKREREGPTYELQIAD